MIFDLLDLDGRDTTGLSYLDRRQLLPEVIAAGAAFAKAIRSP